MSEEGENRRGLTVWFTGLPSSGKTTLAHSLEKRLLAAGRRVEVLDGDAVRDYLWRDLGFSRADRVENVRRVGYVAHLLNRNGVIVICALISPYRESRDEVRRLHDGHFLEVHVCTPASVCEERDVKGLYKRHRAGEISGLTGVDDPYEPPLQPEVSVPAHSMDIEGATDLIAEALPAWVWR